MQDDNFLILRTDDIGREILSDSPAFRAQADSIQLSAETAALAMSDLQDVRADRTVLGVARDMPVNLVAPLAADGAAPAASAGAITTWGVEAVGALASAQTGLGVTVAVLDTGINRTHEAFRGIGDVIEKDFTGEGDGDRNGHGTHCAGTVCGGSVGGKRIGVAPGVDRLLVGKVLDSAGGGTTSGIINGLLWAAQSGANVISMSLGMDFPGLVKRRIDGGMRAEVATSLALEAYRDNLQLFDTLGDLIGRGGPFSRTVIVAASGNESHRPEFELAKAPPSAALGITSVGALGLLDDGSLEVARFSNTGPSVSAPGVSVESAAHDSDSGLKALNGTSMATPHVAGVAALWYERLTKDNPEFEMNELVGNLTGRAKKDVFAPGVDASSRGAGLVQAPTEPK